MTTGQTRLIGSIDRVWPGDPSRPGDPNAPKPRTVSVSYGSYVPSLRGPSVSSLQSVRYAWRSLRRTPVFTAAAVLTLAIGIGAAAAIFAVVDGILLRPLPYGHPEQLVGAWNDLPPLSATHVEQTSATYFTFKRFARSISGIALYQGSAANVADPTSGTEPQRLQAAYITANLIPLLQVPTRLGRSFTDAEDLPNGPSVVIISEGLWRTRFGADPHVLGRTL